MTLQASEIIFINEEKCSTRDEPLNIYIENLKIKPSFHYPTTACWRGYIGTWEVKDDKLYLIDLIGYLNQYIQDKQKEVGLDYLFPDENEVFAEWYTGEIKVDKGEIIGINETTYRWIFEESISLKIIKGLLVQ